MVLKGAACHWETEVALEPLDQDEPDDRAHDGLFRTNAVVETVNAQPTLSVTPD